MEPLSVGDRVEIIDGNGWVRYRPCKVRWLGFQSVITKPLGTDQLGRPAFNLAGGPVDGVLTVNLRKLPPAPPEQEDEDAHLHTDLSTHA